MQDDQPPNPSKKFADNFCRNYACRIRDGKSGKYLYCLHEDKFYIYERGYWAGLFKVEMQGLISEHMPEINKYPLSIIKQVIEMTQFMVRRKLEDFNWSELLNLENGMLNPYQGNILEHDPVYLSTIRLSYKFDSEAVCSLWLKTIDEILENDKNKINILQEFFGYCLTRDTRQEKALLLLGESRSGKSTILDTLREMIGNNNCSNLPLKSIIRPQATSLLMNKLVNIDTDVSTGAEKFEDEFKKITSGERVWCSPKFIPDFEFKPFCKLAMAANTFPRITDHSSAFYKRLILIPCKRIFEENEINRNLKHQLIKEIPGILNWALIGLKRINERNGFIQYDFMKEAVEELREESNPSELFFKEHVEIEEDSSIEKGELYDKYKKWTETTNNYPLSAPRFAICVYQKYSKYTPKNTCNNITYKRIWKNIKYVDNKDAPKPQELSWYDAEKP